MKTTAFRSYLIVMLLCAASLIAGGCASHDAGPPPLKVGIIPFEAADAIQKGFAPFATYLGKQAGRPSGEVFVTPAYSGILQALQSDQIDVAYLNPLSYVLAVDEFRNTPEHLVPLGMFYFHHSLTYRGIVFVRADSGINSIKDLRGKSFAFADRTSTSGYLYPAGLMKEAGLDPGKDVKPVNISGTASVMAVFNGEAAGGAIFEGGLELAFRDPVTKRVDESKVKQFKILATTDPIPNGMIVARANLDPATIQKLKAGLLAMNTDPAGQAALKSVPDGGWDKMVPSDDSIFDPVRKKATILGLSLKSLDEKHP